jgi:membrane-associated phospholipid phosphatase
VLSAFFGPNEVITVESDALPGVTRTFDSYQAVATEAGLSRIFAGQHTPLDDRAGQTLGRAVADFVLRQSSRPDFGLGLSTAAVLTPAAGY